jgi:Protein of unknown function (DUF3224)
MTTAAGSFDVLSGEETTYEERAGGARLTHAWGAQRFSGDITGEGSVHWLMSYGGDKTARYVGLQRITGSLAGRQGSFIIAATGAFDGTSSHGTWSVVEGSGTEGLEGLSGTGSFEAPGGPRATYRLDYDLG